MSKSDLVPYIALCNKTLDERLYEEIESFGVRTTWKAPAFGFVGVEVPRKSSGKLKSKIEELDFIYQFTKERIGNDVKKHREDGKIANIEPRFDLEESLQDMSNQLLEHIGIDDEIDDVDADEITGEGLSVGIIDSGIDTEEPVIENVVDRVNFTSENQLDSTGHGTSVAAITEYVYPDIDIYDFKVVSEDSLREFAVIGGLAEAAALDIDYVNISLGFSPDDEREYCPLCLAANKTCELGTIVTAAAGNHGHTRYDLPEPRCPARAENVIATGAKGSDDHPTRGSAKGNVFVRDKWDVEYEG